MGLVGVEENANYATKALPEHCDEANAEDLVIEQDIMPQNNLNKVVSLHNLDESSMSKVCITATKDIKQKP